MKNRLEKRNKSDRSGTKAALFLRIYLIHQVNKRQNITSGTGTRVELATLQELDISLSIKAPGNWDLLILAQLFDISPKINAGTTSTHE